MLSLTNHQLLRGINPNLAAGNRAVRCPGNSNYQMVTIPHNDFFNLCSTPCTLFLRVLNLGHSADYGYGLFTKSANGSGWELIVDQQPGNPAQSISFRARAGGAIAGYLSDTQPYTSTGLFESFVITRGAGLLPRAGGPTEMANLRLFRNGIEVPFSRQAVSGYCIDEVNPLELGGVNFNFMRGYIDSACFYTVGLSDQEIAQLDDPDTRTDRQAKFIYEFNQLSGNVAQDLTSVGQNGSILYFPGYSPDFFTGRGFVKTEGIRTFRRGAELQAPINGHFTPKFRQTVTGINRYDADLSAAEWSLDNATWRPLTFDSQGRSLGLPPITIGPDMADTTLYTRATNANASFLNALELVY